MGLASAGIGLVENLGELWRLRSVRQDDWGAMLNFVQAALSKEEFERFTLGQCQAVESILVTYLGGGLVREEDVGRVRLMLREVGLDPWKGVSAPKGAI